MINDKTLEMVRVGTDKINFKILNVLPANTKHIIDITKLTKAPVNVRLNKLEEVGLVKRWGYGDKTILTDLGIDFICMINDGKNMIIRRLEE